MNWIHNERPFGNAIPRTNSDSFVQRDEVGESFRRFAFAQVDRNQDQQISLMETADYISDTLTEERQQEALRRLLDQLQ